MSDYDVFSFSKKKEGQVIKLCKTIISHETIEQKYDFMERFDLESVIWNSTILNKGRVQKNSGGKGRPTTSHR